MLFPCRFLQNTEQSSLCYRVGPYRFSMLFWYLFGLSILHTVVSVCQFRSPNLSFPFG